MYDETSTACYRGYPYMAERAEDELESRKFLVGRKCYKKCEENEIEYGNFCLSFKDDTKFINREAIYGEKDITILSCNFHNFLQWD